MVFDEVISLGYRETINLGQIKTISTMESNDERIQAEIQKQKEREAKEESKRRAQMMDLKKKEQMQNARRGMGDSNSSYNSGGNVFGGGNPVYNQKFAPNSSTYNGGNPSYSAPSTTTSYQQPTTPSFSAA